MSDNLKQIEYIALFLYGQLERWDIHLDKKTMTICVTEHSVERVKEELKKILELTTKTKKDFEISGFKQSSNITLSCKLPNEDFKDADEVKKAYLNNNLQYRNTYTDFYWVDYPFTIDVSFEIKEIPGVYETFLRKKQK